MKRIKKNIFFDLVIVIICIVFCLVWVKVSDQSTSQEINEVVLPVNKEEIKDKIIDDKILEQETKITEEDEKKVQEMDQPEQGSILVQDVLQDVPWVVQATSNQWKDERFQDACEETSALMAVSWARGKTKLAQQENTDMVVDISKFEADRWGDVRDSSAEDSLQYIYQGYFGFENAVAKPVLTLNDIIFELMRGNLVVVPTNGQALENPYFTQPGPERHMVVIKGYDVKTGEFITNDPGIGKGEGYRYEQRLLLNAIRDYITGYHEPLPEKEKKTMIVVSKESREQQ